MNFIDLVIIILLIWSAYRGFVKGFILQLSTLAALLLGILGAIKFSDLTGEILTNHFNISQTYLSLIAFACTFIIIVVAVHLLARIVDRFIHAIALGFVNRILGVVFGIAKIAFIISIVLVLINKANDKYRFLPEEKIRQSFLYKPLSEFAPWIFPYLQFDDYKEDSDMDEKKGKMV